MNPSESRMRRVFLVTSMPDPEIALHREAPQVEITMAQPYLLSDVDMVIEGERNRDGRVEDPQ